MECLGESTSNSSNSKMSVDKSDTIQINDENKLVEDDNKDVKTENTKFRNFSEVSAARELSSMNTNETSPVSLFDQKVEISSINIDDDYDLKELNSDILSKQMSNVVTQLEKQVIDDNKESNHCIKDLQNIHKPHHVSIDLTETTEVKNEDTEANNSNTSDNAISRKTDTDSYKEAPVQDMDDVVENQDNMQDGRFDDVQIKVIDVPDDDDLFDFLKHSEEDDHTGDSSRHLHDIDQTSNMSDAEEKKGQEDLQKRELYRFLTASDPTQIHSNEVTPYQSGDEHKYDSDSSDRSGSTEDLSSESDNDHAESVMQHKSEEIESHPKTPFNGELPAEAPVSVRRKPGRKPKIDKPVKKLKLGQRELTERTLERLEACKVATHKWLKDLEVPEQLSLEKTLHLDIVDLNQYLTCGLCKGYLYEASTITECMHTFCKNCIVRHCMEVSLHCPVCNILIHPTDPFVHIRLDRMIQDIVYKILPNVAETEMRNIEAFYEAHPEDKPKEVTEESEKEVSPPKDKEVKPARYQSQMVSLLLESESETTESENIESLEKKFIRVAGSATVANVCEFLRKKLSLDDNKQLDLFCCGDTIEEDNFTLEKIKNKFFGDEDCLMLLQYKIRET